MNSVLTEVNRDLLVFLGDCEDDRPYYDFLDVPLFVGQTDKLFDTVALVNLPERLADELLCLVWCFCVFVPVDNQFHRVEVFWDKSAPVLFDTCEYFERDAMGR